MNLLRCANGHYFDADKYHECPHCAELEKYELTQTIPIEVESSEARKKTMDVSLHNVNARNLDDDASLISEIDRSLSKDSISLETDQDATVGYYANLIGREPVVGFLVCTKGEYFGDSFNLKSGRNFIGRALSMDVVLDMDPMVSRERHAIITYEPRSRAFFAQPGNSHGMFYINDEVVLDNEMLKAYDIISIGNTSLMFIPCCGPAFCWEDLKKD